MGRDGIGLDWIVLDNNVFRVLDGIESPAMRMAVLVRIGLCNYVLSCIGWIGLYWIRLDRVGPRA